MANHRAMIALMGLPGGRSRISATVLVKAAPVLTKNVEETMCVAAVRTDVTPHEWVRIHPIPFRDLEDEHKFRKYQAIELDVLPSVRDRRPESVRPVEGTITLGESLGTEHAWSARRLLLHDIPEVNTCDLVSMNRRGSGAGVPSLGLVRPAAPPQFKVSERDEEQVAEWRRRADALAATGSLFDSDTPRTTLDVVPWRFRYRYTCRAVLCQGHEQTIVDWEAVALWRHVRGDGDWIEKMRHKFEDELWHGKDSVLFVGNMEQRPANFLVLGVFWPPDTDYQQALV
jgi:hypothetical protein